MNPRRSSIEANQQAPFLPARRASLKNDPQPQGNGDAAPAPQHPRASVSANGDDKARLAAEEKGTLILHWFECIFDNSCNLNQRNRYS